MTPELTYLLYAVTLSKRVNDALEDPRRLLMDL